jgi:hypothetical protein
MARPCCERRQPISCASGELLRLTGGALRDHDIDQRWAPEVHRLVERAFQVLRVLDKEALAAEGFHDPVVAGAAVSGLAHRAGVLGDDRVGGQQQDALDCRLRHEQAIEGVLVDRRQIGDRDGMLAGDRELVIAVVQQAPAQEPRVGAKIGAAKAGFDRDFPQARRAEHQLIASVVDRPAGPERQTLRLPCSP